MLFVDIVGFTRYSEDRDPEEVRALITEYFDLARDVAERFGGTVDKYIGDAVMVWWGATESNEDDAERAVRTALDLIDRVAELGEQRSIPNLAARAGVMTGEASVGPGGNDRGLLLGDLVNSASRLQTLAEPGTVYVGEETAALVADAIELEELQSYVVKGRQAPLVAARATAVISERGGRGRADSLTPPFTGRAAELRLLKDMLHATGRESRARLVSVVGQAGIGKSRLIWEFVKYVDGLAETVYWHEGRSPAYGDGLPLWALGEMVRGRARIQETDSDDVGRERLDAAVEEFIDDPDQRAWVRSRLGAILGHGDAPGSDRTELYAAARAFFEGVATRGTTVLVFEDLHWADEGMLEFVQELTDWSLNHPILVVTMARPDLLDRRPGWGSGRRGAASIHLPPLSDEEIGSMVAGTVPGIPGHVVTAITSAAGGVPLFAVEMLRMLIGDGRLVVENGAVTVAGDVDGLEVPSSVHAVVAARLDRLPSEEREVVRDASVLGQSFTIEGLAALRGAEDTDKLQRRLGDLIRHDILEIVRDARSPERGQYQWVQSLLREVAYSRIGRSDRHDLHLRVARYFRDLHTPELAPVAASHFLSAAEHASEIDPELTEEVAAALRAALARAQALHAHEQVLSLAEAATTVVSGGLSMDIGQAAALAAAAVGDAETADRHVASLLERATDADRSRAVWLAGKVANETRRPAEAARILRREVGDGADLGSDPYLARSAAQLARAELVLGNPVRSADLADEALRALERFDLIDAIADALVTRGTALAHQRPRQAMALLEGALAICREHDLTSTLLRCMINIGYTAIGLEASREATERAFLEAKRVGDRSHASFTAGNLAGLYIGDLAIPDVIALIEEPVFLDAPFYQAGVHSMSAWVALAQGDREAARTHLRRARAEAERSEDPQAWFGVCRTEAILLLLDERYADAIAVWRDKLEASDLAPGAVAPMALEVAVMSGDPAIFDEVIEMGSALAVGGPVSRDTLRPLIALHTGDYASFEPDPELLSSVAQHGGLWAELMVAVGLASHDDPQVAEYFGRRALELARGSGGDGLVALAEERVRRGAAAEILLED